MRNFIPVFFALLFPAGLFASPFQGTSIAEGEGATEAYFKNDTLNSEFCCEREYTGGWAQEMSPAEAQRIVNKTLYSQTRRPPRPLPRSRGSGEKGQR